MKTTAPWSEDARRWLFKYSFDRGRLLFYHQLLYHHRLLSEFTAVSYEALWGTCDRKCQQILVFLYATTLPSLMSDALLFHRDVFLGFAANLIRF